MAYSVELKQKALDYLDECGNLSQVATAFGVDRSTIRAWVRKKQSGNLACSSGGYRYNTNLYSNQDNEVIDIVELDEIHSYTKHKNYCWTWIAIDRHTKHILGLVRGKRDTKILKDYTKHTYNITLLCSDYWKAYTDVISTYKHLQSKNLYHRKLQR